ncbi:MAG TPA: preprotein translocase subunit YajC [Mycobacteriales bacterium]|nr:preprotein translocase subunit YajC [Mycobacteriales bacterium]
MHVSHTTLGTILAATSKSSGSSSGLSLIILVAIFGLAYFLFIRPARNRQRQAAQQRRKVDVGDEVTTTAGLIATVVAVGDDELTLEVAPGVQCRYLPAAILRVNTPEPEPSAEGPDASTHEVIEDPDATAHDAGAESDDPPSPAEPADDIPDESASA